ncbi:MAG: hypothetical protein JNL80_00700 [Phycisphaerae bacterium]|jgi:hypothetical protein|nr:hypothetical protein [Phycisphaerae bacterium]
MRSSNAFQFSIAPVAPAASDVAPTGGDNLAFLKVLAEELTKEERRLAPKSPTRARRATTRAKATPDAARPLTLDGGRAAVLLVGGSDVFSRHLRQAQAIVRWDREASHWSHALLLVDPITNDAPIASARILECSITHPESTLEPNGLPMPSLNGVRLGTLGQYASTAAWPHMALLAFALPAGEHARIVERASMPNLDRARYPLWDLLGMWRAYAWGLGTVTNPLLEGRAMPSAAFCDFAYEAAHIDLIPAAEERTTCPEYLWNAGRWWQRQYAEQGRPVHLWHRLGNDQHRKSGDTPNQIDLAG